MFFPVYLCPSSDIKNPHSEEGVSRRLPYGSQYSNFITIKETFYIDNIGRGFKEYILKDIYQDWLESKKVKPKETKLERRKRYSLLLKENSWTWAELSRQLGVIRAWVTMTLR